LLKEIIEKAYDKNLRRRQQEQPIVKSSKSLITVIELNEIEGVCQTKEL